MDLMDEITVWKAPQKGRDAAREIVRGFDPNLYPGDGPYLALEQTLAKKWQEIYENGLQEFHLARPIFEELARKGWIRDDFYFPGRSCHVLPEGLTAFNEALQQGTPNTYTPQGK